MKIYEFCMFHNEHPALELKAAEASRWIDELHLCESNRTFQNRERALVLPAGDDFLKPHVFDGATYFHPPRRWGFSRYRPWFGYLWMARKNETLQRNHVHQVLAHVADDDIVILSDIDEIIDPRRADEVIEAARKHGIVSVELHHTLYYLNLYSTNWHEIWRGSPANYAYRIFVMTGARFHRLKDGSDLTRRKGEAGKQNGRIHLVKGIHGYHHSWLGDEVAALEKMKSYAHPVHEHRPELAGDDGEVSPEKLREFLRSGQSLFAGNKLEIRSFDEIQPLQTVLENPEHWQAMIL